MTVWTGTLPTWTVGPVRAGDLDTMTDALSALSDAWTSYSLAWTSSGTQPAIGNGTLEGRYLRVNKLIAVNMRLVMGSTTTFGTGQYFLSLPVAARVDCYPMVSHLVDFGTANKAGIAIITSGLSTVSVVQNTTDVTSTTPHTWAVSDWIHIVGLYEVA